MPVVVYYGDESYLLEQAAQALRQAVVNPAMASLSHRVFNQPNLATVLEAVGSVSLALGGQTLVEIRDFAYLQQASKDANTDAQLEELRHLLENVEPSKTVLFLSSKLDGKIKFPKWLSKHPQFEVRKFETFKFWETDKAADALVRIAKDRGIELPAKAADMLTETLGTDLRTLMNEVEKLALYAYGRKITPEDVQLLCSHSDNMFTLIRRWILQEHPDQNYKDLQEILLKYHPVQIFFQTQTNFNNIFRVMWLASQGLTKNTIAQRTGQKPYPVEKNIQTFRKVPLQRWFLLKEKLVEMEWKTKTGQLDGQLALEILIGT